MKALKRLAQQEIFFYPRPLWRNTLWVFLAVMAIILFLNPHKIKSVEQPNRVLLMLGFALVYALGYLIAHALLGRNKKQWMRLEFIGVLSLSAVFTAMGIVAIRTFVMHYQTPPEIISGSPWTPFQPWRLFSICAIHSGIQTAMNYSSYLLFLRKMLTSGQNEIDSNKNRHQVNIHFKGKNKNEALTLEASRFLYASSEGHYVNIHFIDEGQTKSKLLRNSMKNIQLQTVASSTVYRCHNSYLINLLHAKAIKGNSNKSVVVLNHVTENIPVSPSKFVSLKRLVINKGQ
ncbi:LytTR family DNA-binding domain-containing protein [Sediminicola luteus]|uniref:HTH LytTR-type domain-containing protein n=1 Tax=Sediminicola luteus TaxID=319238 RepID=A0A2A4G3W6_9FLAO|nr:LytTR family DNA-binding domain-containing protein [Sediminicola luteus]PCE62452.1 hypothetical protein B7P33_19055 [Sediminicola luteus]